MKYIGFILLIFLFTGCAKRTNPKMVKRKISDGTWTLAAVTFADGSSAAEAYAGYKFNFSESSSLVVTGNYSAKGKWELGLNRNPAILYMSFPPGGGLEYLSDDWEVVEMRKTTMRLKRIDSNGGTLTFKK